MARSTVPEPASLNQFRFFSLVTYIAFIGGITTFCSQANGTIITAKSVTQPEVASAIARANHGDTVIVPAGTATWTTKLTISKNITLQGQGVGRTIILDKIRDRMNSTSHLIDVQLARSSPLFRLTGFEFRNGGATTSLHSTLNFNGGSYANESPVPLVVGMTEKFRFDHCRIYDVVGLPLTVRDMLGVIDHVDIANAGGPGQIYMDAWNGRDYGHGSWADDPYWATKKFLFIEDSRFESFSNDKVRGLDMYEGARVVIRHCTFDNSSVTAHGTEGQGRGGKQIECYNNIINFPSNGGLQQLRSGTIITYNNRHRNVTQGMTLRIYRQYIGKAWDKSTGNSVWDENTPKTVNGVVVPWEGGTITRCFSIRAPAKNGIEDRTKSWPPHRWSGNYSSDDGVSYIIKNMSKPVDENGERPQTYLVDSGSNYLEIGSVLGKFDVGDRYEIWKVVTSLDQPGQGKGALLTSLPHMTPRAHILSGARNNDGNLASLQPYQGWPQRGYPLEPCYSWNNINLSGGAGSNVQLDLGGDQPCLKAGRDYFNRTVKAGYPWAAGVVSTAGAPKEITGVAPIAITGTGGYTYPHPLVTTTP
jgi:hypothetical protein